MPNVRVNHYRSLDLFALATWPHFYAHLHCIAQKWGDCGRVASYILVALVMYGMIHQMHSWISSGLSMHYIVKNVMKTKNVYVIIIIFENN